MTLDEEAGEEAEAGPPRFGMDTVPDDPLCTMPPVVAGRLVGAGLGAAMAEALLERAREAGAEVPSDDSVDALEFSE